MIKDLTILSDEDDTTYYSKVDKLIEHLKIHPCCHVVGINKEDEIVHIDKVSKFIFENEFKLLFNFCPLCGEQYIWSNK